MLMGRVIRLMRFRFIRRVNRGRGEDFGQWDLVVEIGNINIRYFITSFFYKVNILEMVSSMIWKFKYCIE